MCTRSDRFLFCGQTTRGVICMDLTYSDMYVLFEHDRRAEAYFRELPGYVQAQIQARERQPSSYDELVRAAEEARKVF